MTKGRPLSITIAQGAFLPVPPLLGGAVEKAWHALGREFAKTGHSVTHVSRSYAGLPAEETSGGVRYVRVRGHHTPASMLRLKFFDLLYSRRVRRVLPRADILVTNTFWLPMLERRRDRGLVYVHVARYPKGQLRYYPRGTLLQTVSQPIVEAIREEVGEASSRIRLVPYPLAETYLAGRPARGAREILYAGRIHPEKGIHLLIAAFARLAGMGLGEWQLRVVGPWATHQGGGGEKYLDELRSLAGSSPVTFVGPVFDETRLVGEYSRAAIFVYPSLAEKGETFGLAALEAMGAGCAPIVSLLPCFRDFIRDGTNGLVFDHRGAGAAERLADTLGSLIRDPARLETFRSEARATAREYALPIVAERYIRDFQEILQERSAAPFPLNTTGTVPV